MNERPIRREKPALVIFSHKSYVDVWPILIESYQTFANCDDFDCFITSDNREDALRLEGTKFRHLYYDPKLAWTDAFFQSVADLSHKKFLFSYDDLILTREVDQSALRSALEQDQFDYLKIICSHVRVRDRLFRSGNVFEVDPNDSYRGSLVFTILSRDLLTYITEQRALHGLSAWEYERQINNSLSESFRYGCVRKNVLRFENLIIKGKVNPVSRVRLKLKSRLVYEGDRSNMSTATALSYHLKLTFFTLIKYFIPPGWFAKFRNVKRRLIHLAGSGP